MSKLPGLPRRPKGPPRNDDNHAGNADLSPG